MDIGIKRELKKEFYKQELFCTRSPAAAAAAATPRFGEIKMSCISSNFSSFFLDSLNDPSEFAKYLGNSAENKSQAFDDYGGSMANGNCVDSEMTPLSTYSPSHHPHSQPHHDPHSNHQGAGNCSFYQPQQASQQQQPSAQQTQHHHVQPPQQPTSQPYPHPDATTTIVTQTSSQQQQPFAANGAATQSNFDNSFTFSKYLPPADFNGGNGTTASTAAAGNNSTITSNNHLMDLDNSTANGQIRVSTMDEDTFDHDSKNLYDVHNSNESTGGTSDHRISSNTSECSDSSNQANNVKPLAKFSIRENFDVHPAHKVEEGIFQHMNKLPAKKKDLLKQLGVTFTGHMSINDKTIIVDNFAKFCEDYGVTDHRPFLSLNQYGMQKPEQIKFARYLGQGLPKFTLFCIYSNYKNLFCTKRFENYAKGSYNLQYILDKTKRFLTSTAAEAANNNSTPTPAQPSAPPPTTVVVKAPTTTTTNSSNNNMNGGGGGGEAQPKPHVNKTLDRLTIFENYEVHEAHRIEDGIFTHIGRLSPKKQEILKQFGIQTNRTVTHEEKCRVIENFMKFAREYNIQDHRPFLDFHESGLPKGEQIKFARYLGQGLHNLTLYKIYGAFKDMLALNRIEKLIADGYNLEVILKKKRKNLINRLNAAKRLINNKEAAAAANDAAVAAAAAATAAVATTAVDSNNQQSHQQSAVITITPQQPAIQSVVMVNNQVLQPIQQMPAIMQNMTAS